MSVSEAQSKDGRDSNFAKAQYNSHIGKKNDRYALGMTDCLSEKQNGTNQLYQTNNQNEADVSHLLELRPFR